MICLQNIETLQKNVALARMVVESLQPKALAKSLGPALYFWFEATNFIVIRTNFQ